MSLVKKFATVGSGTMASRILGFAREMLMAAAVGTGPVAEPFYAAFQFPNTFRRLFAEGAFNAAFVPLFAREIEANGVEGAKKFSEEVFGVLFTILTVLTIVMELAMPFVIRYAIAPGFADDPAKLDMTVTLAKTTFSKYRIQFIGKGGKLLHEALDSPATYTFTGAEGYVRARVLESNGAMAWTQPVIVK